ncbi:MAG: TonB-dependent receptor plug domain-containing protein, partial [Bacteroidales bacterium]|nr:TonB-dependent receptor plug domain-containing protein [Bacteroidales bacterium]
MKTKYNFRFLLAMLVGIFMSVSAYAQDVPVTGTVIDDMGDPVLGANVVVKGTGTGATTNMDGQFSFKAPKGSTLVVTFIGYKTQEVIFNGQPLNITLSEDSEMLEDVVVIGYGVARKNDLTGSVTALKPDEKNHGVVTNAQDMLQGKIAGVNVTPGSGAPGTGATIRIRGGSSLNASNDPLIVIDGMALDNQGVKGLSNGLSMVNPADIETFTVLKDASATAIYGSRGSNGVIIITTKKGRGTHPQISYNGNVSVSKVAKTVDVLNAKEYRQFITDYYGEGSDAYNLMGDANTDWQDEIYRTAISHDHNVTVSGSYKNLPYRLS